MHNIGIIRILASIIVGMDENKKSIYKQVNLNPFEWLQYTFAIRTAVHQTETDTHATHARAPIQSRAPWRAWQTVSKAHMRKLRYRITTASSCGVVDSCIVRKVRI